MTQYKPLTDGDLDTLYRGWQHIEYVQRLEEQCRRANALAAALESAASLEGVGGFTEAEAWNVVWEALDSYQAKESP